MDFIARALSHMTRVVILSKSHYKTSGRKEVCCEVETDLIVQAIEG